MVGDSSIRTQFRFLDNLKYHSELTGAKNQAQYPQAHGAHLKDATRSKEDAD